jgi:hypothetical protein
MSGLPRGWRGADRFSENESIFVHVMNGLALLGMLSLVLAIILGGYLLRPIPWPPPGWAVLVIVVGGGWLVVHTIAQASENLELTLQEN